MYLTLVLSIVSIILTIVNLVIAVIALSKCIGMEKSTHSVQMVPVDPEIDRINQEYTKQWATDEESLKKQEEMYKEEIEDKMPQFYEEEVERIAY